MPNNVKVKVTTGPGWLWGEWACRLPRRERPLERLDCSAGSSHGRDSPSAQKDSFLTVGTKDCSGASLPSLLSLLSPGWGGVRRRLGGTRLPVFPGLPHTHSTFLTPILPPAPSYTSQLPLTFTRAQHPGFSSFLRPSFS